MDPSNSNLVSDGGTLRQIHINEVSLVSTSPTSKKPSVEAGKGSGIRKHIIRKITPLDLQKLQHTGLDRKIAEALNKHKSEQKSSLANSVSNDTKTSTYKDIPVTSTKPMDLPVLKTTNIQGIKLAKNPVITYKNKRNPPKKPVTVPDPLPDIEIEKISILEPQERLVHVKNLLNKKILQKTGTQTNDEAKTNQHLKPPPPPPPPALYESPQRNLMKNIPQEKAVTATKGYTILKEPVEVLASTKSSSKLKSEIASKPKSPKDIARKLDFEAKDATETASQKYFKYLKDPNELKKYAIKSAKSQQLNVTLDSNSTQSIKKVQQKQHFQSEYLKQQSVTYCSGIPKASIKTSPSKEPNSCLAHISKQQKRNDLKMDAPQSSSIPRERSSPLADSPKKFHYVRNSCNQTNPENSSFSQESITLPVQLHLPPDFEATSKVSNCLIVLENKVLSQEEMIDLTELRLSNSTSGFANSHRPIPEVMIKQEKIDEYPETNSFALIERNEQVPNAKKIPNKKNTRIIINTEKLKLPPEKLAALAKKLKQQTSVALTLPKKINDQNKCENVPILSTPAAEGKHPSNALHHITAGISQTGKVVADNAGVENHQICSDDNKKNYSYHLNHTERNLKAVADPNIVHYSIDDQQNVMDKTSTTKNNQSYMDKKLKKKDKCETKISSSTDNPQKARYDTTDIENYKNAGNFHNKSFVEIVDEPLEVDDGLSAVDFILALSKTNHVTEQLTLALSPEELNLNASCSKNFSPVRLQSVEKVLSPRSTSSKIENLKNDSDTTSCKSHATHFESGDNETSKSVHATVIKPNSANISTFKVTIEKGDKYEKSREILIPSDASSTKFSSSMEEIQNKLEISLGELNESCNKETQLGLDLERTTNKNLANITTSNHTTQSNLNTVTPNQNLNEVGENSLAALNSKKDDFLKKVRIEEKKGATESIGILQFESKAECESNIKVNEQKCDDISTLTACIEKVNTDKKGNEVLVPSDTTTTNISNTTYEIQNKYETSVGKVNESCNKDAQLLLDLKGAENKYLTNITGPKNSTPNIHNSCTLMPTENLNDALINTLAASNSKKGDILNNLTSGADSNSYKEKGCRSEKKLQLKTMKGEKSQITEEDTEKNLDVFSTETGCQENIEKSTIDSDWRDSRESEDIQLKDKQGLTKEPQVDDCQRGKKQDFTKCKNNAKGGVITLDIELSKTESRCFSKTVKNQNCDKKENRDIPLAEISKENIEKENSGEKYTDLVIKTTSSANTKILPKDITEISSKNSKPPKRKRGRGKKNPETETSTQINLQKSIISDSSEDDGPSTSAKKPGPKVQRKKLKGEMEEHDSDSSAKKRAPKVQRKKRKGETEEYDSDSLLTPLMKTPSNKSLKFTATRTQRKRLCNESNFNPRLLLIRKRAQLDTDEILTETTFESGSVQCGLCLKHTQPEQWSLHLSEHYGIGWKVGEEELEIEYRSVVLSNMLKYLKNNSSSVLTCRMCQKTYRSALGILNHIELCGAEIVRVECEFCHKDYAASTLAVHMRTCYARSNIDNQSTEENLCENKEKKEVFGKSGRLKRHSTIKAENKLKVLGAELEQINDNIKKAHFDPKSHIKYMTATEENFSAKWSKDIKELGHAICPQFSCKFTSSDEKELASHLKKCKYIKSGYSCNICWLLFPSEKTAIEHVIKSHQKVRRKSNDSDCDLNIDDEVSSDDNNISEGIDENELTDFPSEDDDGVENVNDNRKNSKKQPHKTSLNRSKTSNQTSLKELYGARSRDLDKKVLQKWMNFLKTNYSCKPLFGEFTSQYLTLIGQDFNKYLPSETISMKFNFDSNASLITTAGVPEKGIKWSQLKRFESIKEKMNTYYFLGAPIQVCSWLPLPDHVNEQYLAIVYRQNIFKYTKFTNPKQHHSIILIFKVTQSNGDPDISIHYGLVVNDGPIHNLSFLPSGGYDESSNRLGLVAVATINSCIKIYSLPLKLELGSMQDKEIIPLIEVKPSFILVLDILCKEAEMEQNTLLRTQCLQICWSEYTNHQHIFAGFSNGFIGIWDIVNDPQGNLNRFEGNDIINYVPVNYFYSGEKMVKGMALHYDSTGPRWLAVSTVYRKFIIYDIKNFMRPIILKEEIQKNIPLALDWCPIWETVLISYCDTLQNNGRCVLVISPNNILFTQYKLEIACCGITQIHYTPWTNMLVTGSNNGDIVFIDIPKLYNENPLSKKFGERRMLYGMDIKKLNGDHLARIAKGSQKNDTTNVHSDWKMLDAEYKEKYGLIFKPILRINENLRKIYADESRSPPENMKSIMRINTLRCNLNTNTKNLTAVGYENGFLRLISFNKGDYFKKK